MTFKPETRCFSVTSWCNYKSFLKLQSKRDSIGLENHILDKVKLYIGGQWLALHVCGQKSVHISAAGLFRAGWDSSDCVFQAASKITCVSHIRPRHFWLTLPCSPTVEPCCHQRERVQTDHLLLSNLKHNKNTHRLLLFTNLMHTQVLAQYCLTL